MPDMNNYYEFDLSIGEHAVDPHIGIDIADRNFGSEPEFQKNKIRVYLGNRPIRYNLVELYLEKNQTLPPEWRLFDEYDIWLITYSIQIVKTGGFNHIKQIGLQVKYSDDQLDPKIIILENMPVTKFTKLGSLGISFSAGLGLDGKVNVPNTIFQPGKYFDLEYGGKLAVNGGGAASFNLQFNVLSTDVISVGIGNTYGEWVLNRDNEKPLVGDQLFTQTVLTTKGLPAINCEARVYGVVAGPLGSFPIRLEGKWVPLTADA